MTYRPSLGRGYRASGAVPTALAFDAAGAQTATPEALQDDTAKEQRDGGDQRPGDDQRVEKLIGSPRRHIPGLQTHGDGKQLLVRKHHQRQEVVVPDGHELEE